MLDLVVIDGAAAAAASLDPLRGQILAELREPQSAASLAARIRIPRQKVNYHLRELEKHGLVTLVEERRKGNMTERIVQAAATSFVISPATLGSMAPDPRRGVDQLSARWLIAVASRLVQDVGTLLGRAAAARKPLATFTIDGELTFATAADRSAFAQELSLAVAELRSRYDAPGHEGGRPHRLVVALHPSITAEGTALAEASTPALSNRQPLTATPENER